MSEGYERWEHWCTVYTDASWYEGTRSAAWAVRARYRSGDVEPMRIERAGPCPAEGSSDANHAELYAIGAGLQLALQAWADHPEHPLSGIGIRSDSLTAMRWAEDGILGRLTAKPRHKAVRELQRRFLDLKLSRPGIRIVFKHVKGHQGTDSTRGWLNDKVDNLAREVAKDLHLRRRAEMQATPAAGRKLNKKLRRKRLTAAWPGCCKCGATVTIGDTIVVVRYHGIVRCPTCCPVGDVGT